MDTGTFLHADLCDGSRHLRTHLYILFSFYYCGIFDRKLSVFRFQCHKGVIPTLFLLLRILPATGQQSYAAQY